MAANRLDLYSELIFVLPSLEEVEIVFELSLVLRLDLRGRVFFSYEGLTLLLIWRLADLREIDFDYLVAIFIVLYGEHFLMVLGNEWKLDCIYIFWFDFLPSFLFLLAFVVNTLTLVVILLH